MFAGAYTSSQCEVAVSTSLSDLPTHLRDDRPDIGEPECFLCNPSKDLVFARSESFYAMAGLGPIVEGYTILSAREHWRSFFDVPESLLGEYYEFVEIVRMRLASEYLYPITTEHGRVPVCASTDPTRHEPHCYHAHQLLFPVSFDFSADLRARNDPVVEATDLSAARNQVRKISEGEYLYFEGSNHHVTVSLPAIRPARQYFRLLVASYLGDMSLADWKAAQRRELALKAKARLKVD